MILSNPLLPGLWPLEKGGPCHDQLCEKIAVELTAVNVLLFLIMILLYTLLMCWLGSIIATMKLYTAKHFAVATVLTYIVFAAVIRQWYPDFSRTVHRPHLLQLNLVQVYASVSDVRPQSWP